MSDLVKRLRELAQAKHDDLSIGNEAADRIEELEVSLRELLDAYPTKADAADTLQEISKIREEREAAIGPTASVIIAKPRDLSEKKMIDWDEPIETVDGIHARVLSHDYIYCGERLTVIQFKYTNHSGIGHYRQNGEPAFGSPEIRNRKTKREGWINIYRDDRTGETIYKTKEDAENSSTFKIATIKIKWEE